MNIPLDSQPEPVLLVIADISGYTRYMTANVKALAHSQTIITELVKAVLEQIRLPLEVAKLEGDAVFFVCRKNHPQYPWAGHRQSVTDDLLKFFECFGQKLNELIGSTSCTCSSCTHIDQLKLKLVVHSGEALFHRVLNFVELAGVDVIIVHRLLKNSLNASQYLLVTEPAHSDLNFNPEIEFTSHREIYDDIGLVKAMIYLPAGEIALAIEEKPQDTSFKERYRRSWLLFCRLWLSPLKSKRAVFNHVSPSSSTIGRTAFSMVTLLLTPIFLPVGALFTLIHVWRQPARPGHKDHKHEPDGSCCDHHHH